MKYTIDKGSSYGTTMIRWSEGDRSALVHKAPESSLTGLPREVSYNVPALYNLEDFPEEIQDMILKAEEKRAGFAAEAEKAAAKKASDEAAVEWTVAGIHGSRAYGKEGGYKGRTPEYDLCYTAGNRYRTLIYKGYADPKGAEYINYFRTKHEMLRHFGVEGKTLRTANPGTAIGRNGENIKALQDIAGHRLQVVKK